MGTNFYTKNNIHIGKRSAAGAYCWDCDTTLCKQGNDGVHFSKSEWYKKCPKCGNEVGEYKDKIPNTGVSVCCSFTFAIELEELFKMVLEKENVFDEYGKKYKISEFMSMLINICPIRFYDNIGKEFM